MFEQRAGARHAMPAQRQDPPAGVPRKLAEAEHGRDLRQGVPLRKQMGLTARELFWRRFVVGRCAPDGGGDEGIAQLESVRDVSRDGFVGKPAGVHRRQQKIARATDAIAGEHASCSVGAVGGRRQADDQEAGVGIAEAGDGAPPVDLVSEGSTLLEGDALTVTPQSRTPLARDDGAMHG